MHCKAEVKPYRSDADDMLGLELLCACGCLCTSVASCGMHGDDYETMCCVKPHVLSLTAIDFDLLCI